MVSVITPSLGENYATLISIPNFILGTQIPLKQVYMKHCDYTVQQQLFRISTNGTIATKGKLNHLYCPRKYRIHHMSKLWVINACTFVI
jgi:hypothetical protein